ncbi:succinylglutamate desuccinylase/aspartoacylase family protein [Paenibacillus vini]|uniref:Succinylglutamate desuccinylase/Aspartoacylase catalytic domain-containing protein n=1 Tax=Paenibacillus vini TaxID=1476024 RepID=A0ABQ4M932_9BACL|nr:succinylglutamate desuccinylase/aspartoacylase family protein [Paenibacillus vini]GIP52496.1 hypothetical protein J42TS3_15310 [Paenibacillus vini]
MPVQRLTLAASTPYATPYYVIRGESKGPHVMVVSGIHGNERASVAAAQQLANQFLTQHLKIRKGTLIIVPIVNQSAFRKNIRGVPDLNRTFPRKSGMAARHPLAGALYQLAKRYGLEWYLDLHEANGLSQVRASSLGQTLITNPGNRSIPQARRLIKDINRTISKKSHHFNLRLHELPGSSRTAAARLLKARAVTVETCWSLAKADRVRYQIYLVKGFLRKAGLL